ncbi:DUF3558 family protein [Nocardia aurantiaca]|nr:DUF3558 family protein [Nocardia aurantiaca]
MSWANQVKDCTVGTVAAGSAAVAEIVVFEGIYGVCVRTKMIGVIIAGLALGVVSGCSASEDKPTGMFDPCKEISDRTIRSAGFDPDTKKVVQTLTNYSVKCEISPLSGYGSLYLEHPSALAPIRTYDAYLASAQRVANSPGGHAPTVTKINGRDAYVGPKSMLGCEVNLRTATGVMTVEATNADENTCASAQNIAAILEPSIGSR